MLLNLTENPSSLKIRKLIKKTLEDEDINSKEELIDYIDMICNENIELKKKLRLIHTIVHENKKENDTTN